MAQPGELRVSLHQLLRAMVEKGASDMHITAGAPPLLRIDGEIIPLKVPPLTPVETKQLCYSILTEEQKVAFERDNELDLSFGVKNLSRFRANIFLQRGATAAAIRTIPFKVLSFEELGLPPVIAEVANKPSGLVLVTGPTGSGKSTTLASIIDKINSEQRVHILTIEDPIEYLHPHKMAVVNQRELGSDTKSIKGALKYVLRQDPDVVLVGEMRDLETIEAALTVSETGHLVFATLHTNSAVSTVNRIIDAFPPHQQDQVRSKLSFVLQAVISQQLLARSGSAGRCLAMEIMVPNAAIRNLIRENKIQQIYGQMQVGQEKHGMLTLNQSLVSLLTRGFISLDQALNQSVEAEELRSMLEQRGLIRPNQQQSYPQMPQR
ncbi:MAG: type IV pilus twitching motility protein PilT [Myxococcales bacterium]|nr:type IV pilus twitching motility protein PilT [Myxococcales bacterium]